MLKQREIGQDVVVIQITIGKHQVGVDVLGTDIPGGRLQEHGLVETAPDVLRGVHQVLDAASDPIDAEASSRVRGSEFRGWSFRDGEGEGADGMVDGGDVGGNRLGCRFHLEDGVCRVNEVTVAGANQLPELLLLVLDLFVGGGFHIADFGDGVSAEERFGVSIIPGA